MGGNQSSPDTSSNFSTPTPTVTTSISVMSLYHPFPLRVDNFCERNRQYDACLQIGEFPSDLVAGSKIVILVPLKAALFAGESGVFINAVANKLPNILGQQPHKEEGYPEVPAQPGADWILEKVVNVEKSFYTWLNKDGTRVIVLADPVNILFTDMLNIKRLPLTPPEDVIHEIGDVSYSASPPINCFTGELESCAEDIPKNDEAKCSDPFATKMTEKEYDKKVKTATDFLLYGFITIIVILIVWFGITFAMGSGSTMLKSLGDSLGRSFAGGYDAIRKAKLPVMPKMPESVRTTRRNLANRLGLGNTGKFGTKRQAPVDKAIDDMFPVIEPSEEIKMNTNPLFKSKDDFAKFQNRTRKNPKQGTISAISNLPPTNIPAPAPAPASSVQNIIDDMPSGVTVNPVVSRRRSAQNTRKSSVGSIKNIPQITNSKPPKNTPAAISNRPTVVNPALQEIEELERSDKRLKDAKSSALRKISAISQARNKTPKNRLSDIARQQSSRKASQPRQDPGAGTGLLPSTAPTVPPRRRRIMQEEDDEEEVKKDSRDDEYDQTKLFGSKFLRKQYGLNYGGKRRQKRKKTGRKI